MRCKPASLTGCALLLTILTGCASFGSLPVPEKGVELPAVPADLKTCFAKKVRAPAKGELTKRQLFALVATLKNSSDEKDRCGVRLACWIEDVARGYAAPDKHASPDPICATVQAKK